MIYEPTGGGGSAGVPSQRGVGQLAGVDGDRRSLRLGLVQLSINDGQPRRNLERAISLIDVSAPADLYLLPELWTTGFAHESWAGAARADTPIIIGELRDLSVERGAWIAGSMIVEDDTGRLRNRMHLFRPDGGDPVTYDKAHLFAPMAEDRYLAPGTERVRTTIGPWTLSLSICFDLRFPEMYRLETLEGADLFIVAAEWPAARAEILRILARARAAENQAFLALCNRIGMGADGTYFGGGSALVAPDGRIVADAGTEEKIVVATIDHDLVLAIRRDFPVLTLRKEGVDW